MNRIAYRDWLFECDPQSTAGAYQQIDRSGAEECGCAGCQNFLAQREQVFPEEVLQLFDDLGVDYRRDAEIYQIARLDSGLHSYGGWFHFVGKIEEQPIGPAEITEKFRIDFIPARDLSAPSFGKAHLVQIEITAELPWLITDERVPPPSLRRRIIDAPKRWRIIDEDIRRCLTRVFS